MFSKTYIWTFKMQINNGLISSLSMGLLTQFLRRFVCGLQQNLLTDLSTEGSCMLTKIDLFKKLTHILQSAIFSKVRAFRKKCVCEGREGEERGGEGKGKFILCSAAGEACCYLDKVSGYNSEAGDSLHQCVVAG